RFEREFHEPEVIGKGSFGIVVRGRSIENSFLYAIKIIELTKDFPYDFAKRELFAMECFNNPGIVGLYKWSVRNVDSDFSELSDQDILNISYFVNKTEQVNSVDKSDYIIFAKFVIDFPMTVFQLCKLSLEDWLDTGDVIDDKYSLHQLQEDQLKHFMKQMSSSLAIIHEADVIHRDIHPNNVFIFKINERVNVKIGDFGLCRYPDGISAKDTQKYSKYVGHSDYMSPEMKKEEVYDSSTDIYSLGLVFIRMYLSTFKHYSKVINTMRNEDNK
ncbi:hypothetical protein PENTCL1PPCAC_12124, partial [Pristionchus entomophagus]